MGRDLAAAGWVWDDICSRLPFDQFVSLVVHAPPGTAVFHETNQGWTINDHLQAQVIDALNILVWMKTEDAHKKNPRHRPKPIPRPGMANTPAPPAEHAVMTVGDYLERIGGVI